jgi:hypothetical protein
MVSASSGPSLNGGKPWRAALLPVNLPRMPAIELPRGTYDFWKGDLDELDPAESEVDDAFVEAMRAYEAATPDERSGFRAGLDSAASYRLIGFAQRIALIGLRKRAPLLVRAGLSAETAIDVNTIDFRDAGWSVARLRYCMARLGMDAAGEFAAALGRACPSMVDALQHQVPRVLGSRSLREFRRSDLLSVEVPAPTGSGFVKLSIARFQPRHDLLGALLAVASLVRGESEYQRMAVAAADDFPWVRILGVHGMDEYRTRLLGTVNVHAALRPGATTIRSRYGSDQRLWISIGEAPSADAAAAFCREVGEGAFDREVRISLAHGPFIAYIAGWIPESDVPLHESTSSLERFREPVRRILRETRPLPGEDPFELSGISTPGGLLQ